MKTKSFKQKKVKYIIGSLIFLAISALLVIQLALSVTAFGRKFYPEPEERPNIRKDAVWDSSIGMYVIPELLTNKKGEYNTELIENDNEYIDDYEDNETETASKTENSIDRAIISAVKCLRSSMQNDPMLMLYSGIDARDVPEIVSAMQQIELKDYSELWRRICIEPDYRVQKIVALEKFIGISLRWGLFDQWAQEKWIEEFNELRYEVRLIDINKLTVTDAEKYGALILPAMKDKADNLALSETDVSLINFCTEKIESWLYPGKKPSKLMTDKDVSEWFMNNKEIIVTLKSILENDYQIKSYREYQRD
ncbi:MAG: hypothetical protein IJS38_01645 [Erysipelotrichaceae bacterium]|nr:hypothetical protein [Erysipelotrichaceae bacterium]